MEITDVEKIFSSASRVDKVELLSHLCDIFDSYTKEYKNLTEIIQLIVDFSVTEKDPSLREEYIDALQTAAGSRDVSSINFDGLIATYPKLDDRVKSEIVDILGFSHNPKYIEFLMRETRSGQKLIAATASMALDEMTTSLKKKDEKR